MRIPRSIRVVALAFLACSLPFAPARAAWDPDGNRISFHAEDVMEYRAIPFGAGSVLVVWSDFRYDANYSQLGDVHAQALDADGNVMPGWPAEGLVVANVAGPERFPAVVSDGAGGAYVTWLTVENGSGAFFIQRLTRAGAVSPGWPAVGRLVGTAGMVEFSPTSLVSDGAGGVYLGWGETVTPAFTQVMRLMRIDPDGNPAAGWPADGSAVLVSTWPRQMALAEDGGGGVYSAWADPPTSEAPEGHVMIHRFAADGTPHPAWPTAGVGVGDRAPAFPRLVTDGVGGLYAYWGFGVVCATISCINCPCPSPALATHLDAGGGLVPGWTFVGAELGDDALVASDAAGGLLVSRSVRDWSRAPAFDTRGLATRLRADGTPAPGWSPGGNPVCSERRQQLTPVLVGDGAGGAFASWIDYRTFDPVLYVSHLTAEGSIARGWPEAGSIGSEAAVSPEIPVLVSGGGEAIVLWVDSRTGGRQLFAERVRPGPAGPPAPRTGLGFTVTDIRPNPARGAFWATVSLPEPGIATLELYDVMGRRLESHQMAGGRPGVVRLNGAENLPAGIYTLRLRQGSLPAALRTSIARVAIVP